MPFVPWFRRGSVLFSMLILGSLAQHHERRVPIQNSQVIVILTNQCEARTINYITHSLPQSCLASAWANPTPVSTAPYVPGKYQATKNNASGTVEEPLLLTDASSAFLLDEAYDDPAAKPFMSFEDWKEMMLRRAGQDPQELRQRKPSEHQINDRAPPEFGDSGLGEEGEISLSFDNYHDGDRGGPKTYFEAENRNIGNDPDLVSTTGDGKAIHRSKDAGKTCKERFSYSSFDAGATILKTGQKTKNAKAILVENKDSYMLLECAVQNKYVIVELSDDVQIDTIVIANFEFFSSMIRHFRISVSDRYPVKVDKWRDLGIFEARNSRDIQPFLIQNPQIWARYVRIEFLTHYGNEYYCPVSLLRVHGSRMLDSWKDSETNHEEVIVEEEFPPTPPQRSELTAVASLPRLRKVESNFSELANASRLWSDRFAQDFFYQLNATCAISATSSSNLAWVYNDRALDIEETDAPEGSLTSGEREDTLVSSSSGSPRSDWAQSRDDSMIPPLKKEPTTASADGRQAVPVESPYTVGIKSGGPVANSTAATKTTSSAANGSKHKNTWTTTAISASPTVQEGFFNAITKRLQQVESNLTLSLKYVEDASLHMRDLLHQAEQKQLSKVTMFLGELNQTVLTELRKVQDQYNQVWQSTVLALESQRDQSERDIVALSTRLNVLADEVVFQKRMAIVQAILLLSCLFLVIFSRGVPIPYLTPLQEQSSATYATALPSSTEAHLYATNVAAPSQDRSRGAVERYFSLGITSKSTLPTMRVLESQNVDHGDDFPSPPATPGLPENGTYSNIHTSSRDTRANSLRHPVILHHTSRKPLPSLPEHSVPTDSS